MLSPGQVMNTAFNPLQIVNTYGAFGSITKERYEIVIEGTPSERSPATTKWREYEFKGKPGDPARRPPQVAPYHLRLDWLMWFAAMSSAQDYPWFAELLLKLLEGDNPCSPCSARIRFRTARRGGSGPSSTCITSPRGTSTGRRDTGGPRTQRPVFSRGQAESHELVGVRLRESVAELPGPARLQLAGCDAGGLPDPR
jgi:hypothetical protein